MVDDAISAAWMNIISTGEPVTDGKPNINCRLPMVDFRWLMINLSFSSYCFSLQG